MAYSSFSGLPVPSVTIRTSVVKVTLSPSVKVTGLVNRTMSPKIKGGGEKEGRERKGKYHSEEKENQGVYGWGWCELDPFMWHRRNQAGERGRFTKKGNLAQYMQKHETLRREGES